MTFYFSKSIYSKFALIKSAFNFTDKAYLHLDEDEKNYIVNIESKPECKEICLKEFENEILNQTIRHEIFNKTKNIREITIARAMASTLINESINDLNENQNYTNDYDINNILKDWFENE